MKKPILIVILALFLMACAKPVPEDKLNYIGDWGGRKINLLIQADGTVAYKRSMRGMSDSTNGRIKKFVGDDFIIGTFFTRKFKVTEPPREYDGYWQMTVDGVVLTRISE